MLMFLLFQSGLSQWFSKKMDKPHNCHIKNGGKNLWSTTTEKNKCDGRKEYEESI